MPISLPATDLVRPIITTMLGGLVLDNISHGLFSGPVFHEAGLSDHPLAMAFVDRSLNIEDSVSIRKGLAESGLFSWSATMTCVMPSREMAYAVGRTIRDQAWWKPDTDGIVQSIEVKPEGSCLMTMTESCENVKVGDKLSTMHGMKFTVGEIMEDDGMPLLHKTM